MWLYRAVAYRLVSLRDTVGNSVWPEVTAFIEVPQPDPSKGAVAAHLLQVLATVWGCSAAEVDYYNLWSEGELLRNSNLPASAGDARLLENGWYDGPLFCDMERTVMLVQPQTLRRLVRAQGLAADLAVRGATALMRSPLVERRAAARDAAMPDMPAWRVRT